eukprot:g16129.t1
MSWAVIFGLLSIVKIVWKIGTDKAPKSGRFHWDACLAAPPAPSVKRRCLPIPMCVILCFQPHNPCRIILSISAN